MEKETTETTKPSELIPVVIPKCKISRTAAKFGEMTYEEWLITGVQLASVAECCLWWIGDWLLYGVRSYGERSDVARKNHKALGYLNPDSLRVAMHVSEKVSVVLRNTSLSWSHHKEVAALGQSDQKRFLARAATSGWTVSQLRQAIREWQGEYKEKDAGPMLGVNPMTCTMDLLRFYSQEDGKRPIEDWPYEKRAAHWADSKDLYAYLTRLRATIPEAA